MASQNLFYPLRSVIRCVAKAHLTVTPEAYEADLVWDEALFTELTSTFLQPAVQPLLAAPCESRDEAALIEGQLAQSLVNAYRRILRQRQNTQVQQLNALL
ncbi:hypothetical protein N836_23265 [Leptolyngbya sp. Heron Island J]|uniref:hypothetical protein n=1 Tax=Leptolyngbya sp. Heron Island J TaxID=1385935 RepID=UPI0003B98FC3|nr:hypothetical protein [Leptolyngbya sp. Heron Island J]ESA32986.1 hypothetical protein N836_23265 [Leptolyngbya sp. Heron Island J]